MTSREVDKYFSRLDLPHRETLQQLRRTIQQILPDAEEVISYGFPGFKLEGKIICGYDAFKNHCSYFPHSSLVIPALQTELAKYKTSKGAIQFSTSKPLPKQIVKKLITTRIRQLREGKN
jgi:uncharacterized protein YdhG (YjbR/CyaY superfamily)